MGTTFMGVDVIDVSLDILCVRSIVGECNFDWNAFALAFKIDDI